MTAKSLPEGQPFAGPAPLTARYQFVAATEGVGVDSIFSLPAGAIVLDLQVIITQAFTASVTATIGDGVDPDRFMDSTQFAPQTLGGKSMKQDAQPGSGGHKYAAADTIDITIAGATPAAGTAEIFLTYLIDQNYAE